MPADFDTRAAFLGQTIEDSWETTVKELWRSNQAGVRNGLAAQFGSDDWERKERDFIAIGTKPFSVLAFHNTFQEQIRISFVAGGYYPALVGACALGERILNHIVFAIREDFRKTDGYKKVYRKKSFDDCNIPLDVLEEWGVLLPDALPPFRALQRIRNESVHFSPNLDIDCREPALRAIEHISKIVEVQFSAWGNKHWTISIPGEVYLKETAEALPFIARVWLKAGAGCVRVGPEHQLEHRITGWHVHDRKYDNVKISDEEFTRLRAEFLKGLSAKA
jgi:hypothetical protein